MCMSLRGVRQPGALTTTSALRGRLREDPRTRQEFFELIGLAAPASTSEEEDRDPPEHRDRGRRPRRRQGGADAARGGLRRAPGAGGQEPERPYERPPLSKDYLRGEVGREKVYVHEPGFYDEHGDRAAHRRDGHRHRPAARTVTLADGERLAWDRLLLATGAEPRRLKLPGADLDGVLYLRTLADSDRLREHARPRAAGWSWSAPAGSARRPPPRRASSAWR